MLYEGSIGEIKRGRITKSSGLVVVAMRHYPRFLKRELVHEYQRRLAPGDDLFADFRAALGRGCGHDQAFDEVNYENRFELSQDGLVELARLSELAKARDVLVICQCEKGQKCHRHLLLLMARELFQAPIDRLRIDYPVFEARIPQMV